MDTDKQNALEKKGWIFGSADNFLKESEILQKVKLGMTRQEVFDLVGEPTDHVLGSRKYPRPIMYVYGEIRLDFSYPKDGGLLSITKKDSKGIPVTLLGPEDPTEKKLIALAGQNPVNKLCRIKFKKPSSDNLTVIERKIVNPRGYWIDVEPTWGEGCLFVLDIREIEVI